MNREEVKYDRPLDLIDRAFKASLYLKGIHGLLETTGGIILLIVKKEQINRLVEWLTHNELGQDPHDFIASHIQNSAHHLTKGGLTFAAIYLLSHGVIKLILIIEVLRDRLWAYPALITVVGLFIVYQIYLMITNGVSAGLMLLTIFDFIIIYLTQKEYRRHKDWQQKRLAKKA